MMNIFFFVRNAVINLFNIPFNFMYYILTFLINKEQPTIITHNGCTHDQRVAGRVMREERRETRDALTDHFSP